ncbi:MAG: SDR family NAD(P)-dependent oxidoreductase [bacterium]|nr:SDR family NAD(P)-dependent oxidoreductase [bacterium]
MRVALLGATRGMGRALARRMAARGDRLFLLGRDERELELSARDLELHGAEGPVGRATCDLARVETFAPALDAAQRELGRLETVVVSAGVFAEQTLLEAEVERCVELLQLDFVNTVAFCEQARRRLVSDGNGTLCVFSSVAGDRARKPVVLYGAAKAGLSHYLEGLDHKFRAAGLTTVCVKPGFVRTGMTAGLPEPPFAGDPDDVARTVLRAIDRGKPVVYAPPIWRWILFLIRHLPRTIMRRVGF